MEMWINHLPISPCFFPASVPSMRAVACGVVARSIVRPSRSHTVHADRLKADSVCLYFIQVREHIAPQPWTRARSASWICAG